MEENYLVSLIVVFFFFGLSFFRKDTKISFDTEKNNRLINKDVSGNTGVAKYLKNKQDLLQEKLPSGVEKYLALKGANASSGVSKYLARQQSKLDEKK